jgi:regulatory protein
MSARGRGEPIGFQDGVVTALAVRGGQTDRVGVYLDGRLVFDLSSAVVDRAGLRAGDLLSGDRQRELHLQDAPYRARERALRFLSLRDRSQREVEIRLRQAGFDPQVISETVSWLAGVGYLNDRRFAAAYAAEKRRSGWGPRRIRAELAKKGVERPIVEAALGDDYDGGHAGTAEGEQALETLVRKRFASQFTTDPDAAERRLSGFLARRGYDWDTIGRLARTLRAEAGDEPSE